MVDAVGGLCAPISDAYNFVGRGTYLRAFRDGHIEELPVPRSLDLLPKFTATRGGVRFASKEDIERRYLDQNLQRNGILRKIPWRLPKLGR